MAFDQIYPFDRDALIKAILRPEKVTEVESVLGQRQSGLLGVLHFGGGPNRGIPNFTLLIVNTFACTLQVSNVKEEVSNKTQSLQTF